MRKLTLFMHVSLDGFTAGPNGEMDWIKFDDELFEYAGFQTDRSDTALYGRTTFDMMQAYWPTAGDQPDASKHDKQHAEWYNRVDKVVVSKTMEGQTLPGVRIISDDAGAELERLKHQPGGEITVFGSPGLAHTLMRHNLIDDYWLFVNPVLLGEGIPLFKNVNERVTLQLAESKVFGCGVAGLHYAKQ